MFDNIEKKIKIVAKIEFWASVIWAIFLLLEALSNNELFPFLFAAVLPLIGYLSALFIYALGEFLENTKEIKNTIKELNITKEPKKEEINIEFKGSGKKADIFSALDRNNIKNVLSLPYWIYDVETSIINNHKNLKIYLFNHQFDNRKLDNIVIEINGKEYSLDFFKQVEGYNSDVVGTMVSLSINETIGNIRVIKETINGYEFTNNGKEIVYSLVCPVDNHMYIAEKISAYKKNHEVFPKMTEDYWQCSCGRVHDNSTSRCACGSNKETIQAIINFDFKENYIDDYVTKGIDFNLNNSFEKNIADYKNAFKYKYAVDPEEMINRVDLIKEEERYKELLKKKKIKEKKNRRNRILAVLASVIALFAILFVTTGVPGLRYFAADIIFKTGNYDNAIVMFENLDDFWDSKTRALEAKYLKAEKYLNEENYTEAITLYGQLTGTKKYKDSTKKYFEAMSLYAQSLLDSQNYEEAYIYLKDNIARSGSIKNYQEMYYESCYMYAQILIESGDYTHARTILLVLPSDYKDTASILQDLKNK